MHDDEPRFLGIVRTLAEHEVEYVLVGGLAAVLHGAPIVTQDADILHHRTPENVARLLRALDALGAVYRGDRRNLSPGPTHLIGPGHHLLSTRFGDLDVLGTIGDAMTYEEVAPHAARFSVAGFSIPVIGLRALIASKEQAGRPKDLAVLPTLRATLEEIERE